MNKDRFAISVTGSITLMTAMLANLAHAQLLPPVPDVPDVPGAVQDATNTAQETAKDATNTAQDTAKAATDTAQDTAKSATDTAQDTVKSTQDTAKDVQKDATKGAQETTRDAQRTLRDAQRNASKTARETTDDLQDTAREGRDAARDATRDRGGRTSVDARANVRGQGSFAGGRRGDYRSADFGLWFDRSNRAGLVIADVAANAALSAVGFREGDRIVSLGGQTVTTEADFVRLLTNPSARGRMNVVVLRDGQQETLYIEPNVLHQHSTTFQMEPLEHFGIILDDRIENRVVIWRVLPRTPAFYAGLRAGDVITAFANRPVSSPQAFTQLALETKAGNVPIQISRNGRMRMIEADFPEIQTGERYTAFRQNLDADVDIDTRSGVEYQADAMPDREYVEPQRGYYRDRWAPRRGWFRRGR
jgi:predicted metalloprotease with PDZ domain